MGLYIETPLSKIIHPHKYQVLILLTKIKETACVTGQGSGKSSLAPVWLGTQMMNRGTGEYAVTEPVNSMVERVAIRYFLDFVKGTELEGDWISKKYNIYGTNYGTVNFYSTEIPEHMQGSHLKAAVMDEAGQSPRLAYTTLRGRLNLFDGQLLMLSNPYMKKDPWLFLDLKKRYDEGDPTVLYLSFPSIANPAFSRKVYERDKKILTPEEFSFQHLGVYIKPQGLVYDYDRSAVVKEVKYNGETCFAGGDFGFDSTTLEIGFVNTVALHLVNEYFKVDIEPSGHVRAFAELIKRYHINIIFYDPAARAFMSEIQKGLTELKVPVKFEKANNDVHDGVREKNRALKGGKLIIDPKCYHLLDEDMGYIWKNGEPSGERHCEDASRYLIMGVKNFLHREYAPTKVEKKAKDWLAEHFQNLYDKVMNPKRKENIDWRDVF